MQIVPQVTVKCTQCLKICQSQWALEIHARIHTGECPYPCPVLYCNRKFKQTSGQYSHLRRNHLVDTHKLALMWGDLRCHPSMQLGGPQLHESEFPK